MIVNSTEMKNNFGKYLHMSAREDIIITCNGRRTARLISYEENYDGISLNDTVKEGSVAYEVPPRKVSYEEFLEINENTDQRLEYIDGEIYLLTSPKTSHQKVLGELYILFNNWFKGKKCKPMIAPYDITLKKKDGSMNLVQPDIMVICDLNEKLNERDYYMGIPSLVVEILSEVTRSKDYTRKMNLYMYSGVEEYWIVNPMNKEISVFLFDNYEVKNNSVASFGSKIKSFVFEGLEIDTTEVF